MRAKSQIRTNGKERKEKDLGVYEDYENLRRMAVVAKAIGWNNISLKRSSVRAFDHKENDFFDANEEGESDQLYGSREKEAEIKIPNLINEKSYIINFLINKNNEENTKLFIDYIFELTSDLFFEFDSTFESADEETVTISPNDFLIILKLHDDVVFEAFYKTVTDESFII